ncbi:MAG: transcriptional regulator [Sphingomonas sp.]|nr:transcriptional regulator [Sphingomonas sp.]
MTRHTIGAWTFEPGANELHRDGERRRLEHRAAATLELLCRRPGEIVTTDDILAQVWNGRAISPNSIPVVISDLRQALEDDARSPRYIETVAKRGYRLMVERPVQAPIPSPTRRVRAAVFALIALVLALGGALAYATLARPKAPVLVVRRVQNGTGNPVYDPLANASSAVLMTEAEQLTGVQVFRGPSPRPDAILLDSILVIWNGRPTVMMAAQRAGGPVLWTGMTAGGEQRIPYDIALEMHRLGQRLRP